MLQANSTCALFLLALGLSVEGRLLGSPGKATTLGERSAPVTLASHGQALKGHLGSPGKATTLGQHSAVVTPVSHSQAPALAKPASKPLAKPAVAAAHTNHSTKAQMQHVKKNLTEMQQLANFKVALETIKNLQADFTAGQDSSGDAQGMQQIAEGAMTTELHKQDSKFWGSIQQMLKETTGAMSKMTNATASGRKNILHDLESSINASADTLKNVTENAGKKQEEQSDEYLVGLLNQHQNEWSMEKQLTVTKQFSSSPTAQELLKHHNVKEPLAAQLARLMDSARSSSKSKANKAAKLFLQLEDVIHDMRA
jgi:hypothetical protein